MAEFRHRDVTLSEYELNLILGFQVYILNDNGVTPSNETVGMIISNLRAKGLVGGLDSQ